MRYRRAIDAAYVGVMAALSLGCTGTDASAVLAVAAPDASPPLGACPGPPGYVCTPALVPDGWAVVGRSLDLNQPCPSNFGGAEEVLGAPKGDPLGCTCSCSGSPACTTFSLDRYFAAACGGAPTKVLDLFASGPGDLGVCKTGSYTGIAGNNYVRLDTPPASDAECSAAPSSTMRSPITGDRQRLCVVTDAAPLRACATGVCVPQPTPSYAICIAHEGEETCPAGFPLRTVAGTGETPYSDARACGPCSCTVKGDCTASFQLVDDACTFGPTMDTSSCRKEGVLTTRTQYKLTAYANTRTCGVGSPSTPRGGVTPVRPRTICCS